MIRLTLATALLTATLAVPAVADPLVGTWQTPPDRKNLTSHITIAPCGTALCGTVAKAFDPSGTPVQTPNVGKRIAWDLMPTGGGAYEGQVYVPLLDVNAKATAELAGSSLTVRGCKGPICDKQTWTRLK